MHVFYYDRDFSEELKKYCSSINYYKRKTGFLSQLSFKPYIVYSRRSKKLIKNLLKDNYPILFEGLHTTYYIKLLKNRQLFVRTHNIEHEYYFKLAKYEKSVITKLFFIIEAIRLRCYERNIRNATILTISNNDFSYFKNKYKQVLYLPPFHPFADIHIKTGNGNYILFHGDLSVRDNIQSLKYLTKEVFCKIDYPVKVAGYSPSNEIEQLIKKYCHIELIANPGEDEMNLLISNAHIITCYTFQPTGIKLKLLASLYSGRFCIVNEKMVDNTGLEELCQIKNSPSEIKNEIVRLMNIPFLDENIDHRKKILLNNFSNEKSAKAFKDLLINVNDNVSI